VRNYPLNSDLHTVTRCMYAVSDPLAARYLLSIYARLTSGQDMQWYDREFIRNLKVTNGTGRQTDRGCERMSRH